jgi:hypothetical protein
MNKTRRLYQLTPEEARVIDAIRIKAEKGAAPPNEWARRFPKGSRVIVTAPRGTYITQISGTVVDYTGTGIRVDLDPDLSSNSDWRWRWWKQPRTETYLGKSLASTDPRFRVILSPGSNAIVHRAVCTHRRGLPLPSIYLSPRYLRSYWPDRLLSDLTPWLPRLTAY